MTDAQQRKAVPIIRSLGRNGIEVFAGDSRRLSIGFFSKYCSRSFVYPSPIAQPDAFIDWLLCRLQRDRCDVLFPIDERTMGPVTAHRHELAKYCAVPIVDHVTYLQARDKASTLRVALANGIHCPQTYYLDDPAEAEVLAKTLDFPVVIKARRSQGSRGIVYVRSRADFVTAYLRAHAWQPLPLVQDFIPPGGDTFGVEALFGHNAQPLAAFVHRRLREYPISGGPSTLREGVMAPELMETGLRLLAAMHWFGVAMVEFKVDPRDNQPKLMEVNPKFWGSVQLAIVSGVDFPYLLYRLAVGEEVTPIFEYRAGVRCRWLLPGDLLHFLSNPKRFKLRPSFFDFRGPDRHDDLICRDDLGPLFVMPLSYLAETGRRSFWQDLRR